MLSRGCLPESLTPALTPDTLILRKSDTRTVAPVRVSRQHLIRKDRRCCQWRSLARRAVLANLTLQAKDGYPLFFHRSGRIARKVKGDLHYFGRWGRAGFIDDLDLQDAGRVSDDANVLDVVLQSVEVVGVLRRGRKPTAAAWRVGAAVG